MIQGHFDRLAGRNVCGWIWDTDRPDEAIEVHLHLDGQPVASGWANVHRPDLENHGFGNGVHGFEISLPDPCLRPGPAALDIRSADGISITQGPVQVQLPDLRFRPIAPVAGQLPVELAICAVVRNEAPYLLEWIAWHRLVGVSHFVLFDNDSDDATTDLLALLARQGVVDHVRWPGLKHQGVQIPAYMAGLGRLGSVCRWVAFIDADEFLTPLRGHTVPQILSQQATAAGLVVPWRLYGSSGHQTHEPGLVVERFTHRAPDDHPLNQAVKTIVQPRTVMRPDIHTPHLMTGSLVDEFGRVAGSLGSPQNHPVPDAQTLVVSHFFTKSREEWDRKRGRGRASVPGDTEAAIRPDHHFELHDLNQVPDTRLARWAPAIRAEMARLNELLYTRPVGRR